MLSTSQQAPMGNRSTLITIGKNGELRHLFWPTQNYPQHVRGSLPGIICGKGQNESFSWLTDDPWRRGERYLSVALASKPLRLSVKVVSRIVLSGRYLCLLVQGSSVNQLKDSF